MQSFKSMGKNPLFEIARKEERPFRMRLQAIRWRLTSNWSYGSLLLYDYCISFSYHSNHTQLRTHAHTHAIRAYVTVSLCMIQLYLQLQIHIHIHACTYTHRRIHVHMHMHMQIHINMRIPARAWICKCTYTCRHPQRKQRPRLATQN